MIIFIYIFCGEIEIRIKNVFKSVQHYILSGFLEQKEPQRHAKA